MSKKYPKHDRSNRRSISKKDILRFIASGQVVIGGGRHCPVTLQVASLDGKPPVFVEMTPESDFADIGLRVGFFSSRKDVTLRVCGREFTVGIARHLKNTPLLWLDSKDFFAGLFRAGSGS
jgi:hypothetical protein